MKSFRSLLLAVLAGASCRLPASPFSKNEIEIPGYPAAWTVTIGHMTEAKGLLWTANKLLAEPIPELTDEAYLTFSRTGDRSTYEKPYGWRLNALEHLTVAEELERKGRYLPRIAELMAAICAEKTWVMPAHDRLLNAFNGKRLFIDLGAGERAEAMTRALVLFGDQLPREVVERAVEEITRRVIDPYLDLVQGGPGLKYEENWWVRTANNWNAVCNSSALRVVLALCPDAAKREAAIAFALKESRLFLSGFSEEGYCTEGAGYWNFGFGHYLKMALAVRTATAGRVDFLADPKWRKVMEYGRGFWLDAKHSPYFADGGGSPRACVVALCRAACPGGDFAQRLDAFTAFPDAQVFIGRTAEAQVALALKGGHNDEFHNHNDLGSWEYLVSGVSMAGDPGGEKYTARTFSKRRYESPFLSSYGHPVPVIDGKLQSAGRAFAARVLAVKTEGSVRTVALDLKGAYDCPGLIHCVRTIAFDCATGKARLEDEFAFDHPCQVDECLPTYADVTEVDAASVRLSRDGVVVRAKVASSSPLVRTEERLENPHLRTLNRVAWRTERPVMDLRFTLRLNPAP